MLPLDCSMNKSITLFWQTAHWKSGVDKVGSCPTFTWTVLWGIFCCCFGFVFQQHKTNSSSDLGTARLVLFTELLVGRFYRVSSRYWKWVFLHWSLWDVKSIQRWSEAEEPPLHPACSRKLQPLDSRIQATCSTLKSVQLSKALNKLCCFIPSLKYIQARYE